MASELTLAQQLGDALRHHHLTCAVAESCTGGRVASAITEIPGSSQWFDRGYVTYTNESKTAMLGVSPALFINHGAVSEAVVIAMAEGVLNHCAADVSVAISGVAGPSGGTPEKPVGTVWLAWTLRHHKTIATCHHFDGDRSSIRTQAVREALQGLISILSFLQAD